MSDPTVPALRAPATTSGLGALGALLRRGDLALAGYMICGTYRAFCPGHKLNVLMLQRLFADRSAYAIVDATSSRREVVREYGHGELTAPAMAFGPVTR